MGRHVCFVFLLLLFFFFFFFFLLFVASGELTTERIELKFSLKIALVPSYANKLHSAIRPVVGLQYTKMELGYHDFHQLHYYSFLNRKNVSAEVFLGAEFDRDIQSCAKILGTVKTGVPTRKMKFTIPGFQLTAFYAQVRLVKISPCQQWTLQRYAGIKFSCHIHARRYPWGIHF